MLAGRACADPPVIDDPPAGMTPAPEDCDLVP
jgi:hypothetical protein